MIKKKGLFKMLENIKDTNLTQLQAIKDHGEKQHNSKILARAKR